MPEEPATRDLVALTRGQWAAVNRGDLDALMRLCPPDAVYDPSPTGVGIFEGRVAIRGFLESWWGAFEAMQYDLEEVRDLGNGVVFAVVRQNARPAGSSGYVRAREAYVYEWADGLIDRVTIYLDIDEARALGPTPSRGTRVAAHLPRERVKQVVGAVDLPGHRCSVTHRGAC